MKDKVLISRLEALNEFLSKIYGAPTKFSSIILDRIRKSTKDEKWILGFLDIFQELFVRELQSLYPDTNQDVISFSLGTKSKSQDLEPNVETNFSVKDLQKQEKALINFLKDNDGKSLIDSLALRATLESFWGNESITEREQELLLALYDYFGEHKAYPNNPWLIKQLNPISESGLSNLKKNLREKGYLDSKFTNAVLTSNARALLRNLIYVPPVEIAVLGDVKAGKAQTDEIISIQDVENLTIDDLPTISIPNITGADHRVFALMVNGDSMERENIFDGDYVVVQRFLPHESPKEGELIVARYLPPKYEEMVNMQDEGWTVSIPNDMLEGPTLKRYYPGIKNLNIRHKLSPYKEDPESGNVINTWFVFPIGKVISSYRPFK